MSATKLPLLLSAVAVLLFTQGGCDKDIAFFIYQNQVPEPGCKVLADTTVYRPRGLLDVSLGRGYQLFPLLRNELPPRVSTAIKSDDADPNALHLREFTVSVDLGDIDQSVDQAMTRFTYPVSGTMLPGDKRVSTVEVIPDELARTLKIPSGARPTVLAEVRARADSADGEVESLPFFYPVELCNGCLVTLLEACPDDLSTLSSGNDQNVCGLPQDAPLLCCEDPKLGLICPTGAND